MGSMGFFFFLISCHSIFQPDFALLYRRDEINLWNKKKHYSQNFDSTCLLVDSALSVRGVCAGYTRSLQLFWQLMAPGMYGGVLEIVYIILE